MSRLVGIAAVQMSVVPWDAEATVKKMGEVATQIARSFPWTHLILFHELVVPGLMQFVATEQPDTWRKNAQPIPGPLTDE